MHVKNDQTCHKNNIALIELDMTYRLNGLCSSLGRWSVETAVDSVVGRAAAVDTTAAAVADTSTVANAMDTAAADDAGSFRIGS